MHRLVLVVLCLSATARADDDASATDPPDAPDDSHPAPTSVHARLDGTAAHFIAKFTVPIKGPTHGGSDVVLDLPATAVATRATITAEGQIHPLELLPAEQAKQRYEALTFADPARVGDAKPNRWGVLLEGGPGHIDVSVAAPRSVTLAIEVELQAPTCFFRDARYVAIPPAWKRALDASARVPAQSRPVTAACAGPDLPDETWIGFASRELAVRPAGNERVGALAGAITLGQGRDQTRVARFEVDIASVLGEVPRDLATAIVVDGSRSLTPGQIDAQRELVLSYLDKAPSSRVQVIAFARRARALLPAWSSAAQATVRVDRELRALAPRNGSNFDAGLAEAASWLGRIAGTHRIVLMTDDRMAKRLYAMSTEQLRALLPRDTLVHVVALDETEAAVRDDTWTLAPLAALTHGHSIRSGLPEGGVDATLLVRPIQLDNIAIAAPGWSELRVDAQLCGDTLAEGRSCVWWGKTSIVGKQPAPIAVEAKMWGDRVTRVLAPDLAQSRDVARELVTFSSLDTAIAAQATRASRAVSNAWSLYAEWGGRIGYDGFGSITDCGCGDPSQFGIGSGHSGVGIRRSTPALDLLGQLAEPVARCHPGRQRIDADVETTLSEIVDVVVRIQAVDPMTPEQLAALRTCVEDAIWDTAITVPPHIATATTRVAFVP
jgi:VWA domain-containing protein